MSKKPARVAPDLGATPVDAKELAGDLYPVCTVPFYGRKRPMILRRLSQNQVKAAIGDLPLNWGPAEEKPGHGQEAETVANVVTLIDSMDKAARAVMVRPSYDEILAEIDALRPPGARVEALAEVDRCIKDMEQFADPDAPEVIALQAEADNIRAMELYPLPEDTYGFLFSFAIRADDLDMRVYNRMSRIRAALEGEKYSVRPSEVAGIEEERGYLREQFDFQATNDLHEYRELHKGIGKPGKVSRG